MSSILWYDLETTGRDPRRHRILQVGAVRTDLQLNEIDEPFVSYAQLDDDVLPEPEALLITGISPEKLAGAPSEPRLLAQLMAQMSQPETCSAGYNTLRFDDEFLRFGLFRNFHDPYAREWQKGNSRWDLIDLVRAAAVLRPDGVQWPLDGRGQKIFKLDQLSVANGFEHEDAHDAAGDVRVTIAMARLLRQAQPRLFDYYFGLRDRRRVESLLLPPLQQMVVHVSGHLPKSEGHLAVVAPVAMHPVNQRSVIVFDLRQDPQALLDESVDELKARLFASRAELGDRQRPALKEVRTNKVPFVAPVSVLASVDCEALDINLELAQQRMEWLQNHPEVAQRVSDLYARNDAADSGETGQSVETVDAEAALYNGFVTSQDRDESELVRGTPLVDLESIAPNFSDERLQTLWLRYRGRHAPQSLSSDERVQWQRQAQRRLREQLPGFMRAWQGAVAMASGEGQQVLASWAQRVEALVLEYDVPVADLLDDLLPEQAAP